MNQTFSLAVLSRTPRQGLQIVPLCRNFRTRTTTCTFPPGAGLETPSDPLCTATPSLERRDGLEAVDLRAAEEAALDCIDGLVIPVAEENPDNEAEDCEPEAMPGAMWW